MNAMNPDERETCFFETSSPEHVRREKEKARALRKTQWWRRQIAGGVCRYCGGRFRPEDLTMDHIVPLIRGGSSTRGNVAPSCKDCNNKKKYLLPIEWDDYLQRMSKRVSTPGETPIVSDIEGNQDGTV